MTNSNIDYGSIANRIKEMPPEMMSIIKSIENLEEQIQSWDPNNLDENLLSLNTSLISILRDITSLEGCNICTKFMRYGVPRVISKLENHDWEKSELYEDIDMNYTHLNGIDSLFIQALRKILPKSVASVVFNNNHLITMILQGCAELKLALMSSRIINEETYEKPIANHREVTGGKVLDIVRN